ncbi:MULTISPECIES: hypothetical protein [unclassified Acinetobacter]|uniref:hypothetical protein n=1 Tax=unclassified Acinetobacter TaxID=196816 RepID=UPI0015D27A6B|nr:MULTISPECIES: hypothetical protein [unclassified Acinetobacter]
MLKTFYLGQTDYKPKPYTRINCIAKAVNGAWKKQNLINELPPFGKLFAVNLPWVQEGQLIAITAEENPKQASDGQDHFIVKEPFNANIVLDYRTMTMEQIRYKLVETGLTSIPSYSDEVIVAFSDTECLVVKVKPHPSHGRYVTSPGVIDIYSFNKAIFEGDTFNGQFIEIPEDTVGDFVREITWKLDQELLGDVLKKLKQFDDIEISKKEREKIISILHRAMEIVDEDEDWEAIKDWGEAYSKRINLTLNAPEQIANTFLTIEPVRQELEKLKSEDRAKYYAELKSIIRQEIENELKELTDRREKLQGEIVQSQNKLTELTKTTGDLEGRISNLNRQLIFEINQLNKTLGHIQDLDSQECKDLLDRFKKALQDSGKLISPVDSSIPPWSRGVEAQSVSLINQCEFCTKLENQARKTGIQIEELRLLDVALRSGALTILPQHSAEILISKYAQVITGGIFFREPLGPNILNLDDLWVQPSIGKMTGFARAWSTALQNPDQYHIIWLDGIQRTAIDLWLPSLIGVLYGAERPKNLLVVATITDGFLDNDRLWDDLSNYSIPIASEIERIRSKSLLQQITQIDQQFTRLNINESEFCLDEEIDEFRLEMEEKSLAPHLLETEIRLFIAESFIVDEKTSIRDRLKKYLTLRENGQKWLTGLLEK